MFGFLFRLARRRLLIAALPMLFAVAGAALRWLARRRRPTTEGAGTVGPPYGETSPRGVHTISLRRTAAGARFDDVLSALRAQLGARAVGDPDESGFFEVEVEAATWDDAAAKLRDAVASTGGDDVVELGEPSGRLRT